MKKKLTPENQDRADYKALMRELRKIAFSKSGGRCWYCGREIVIGRALDHRTLFAAEHQQPRCRGGEHSESNVVAACFSCNAKKGKKTVEEYRQWFVDESGAVFTDKQIAFWSERGIELPPAPLDAYPVFHGEK